MRASALLPVVTALACHAAMRAPGSDLLDPGSITLTFDRSICSDSVAVGAALRASVTRADQLDGHEDPQLGDSATALARVRAFVFERPAHVTFDVISIRI